MILIQDSREQSPLQFAPDIPVEIGMLPVGDYGVKGFSDWERPAFIIERKSLEDLCGSLGHGRSRFMREIEKMRQFGFRAIIIEARREQVESSAYRSLIAPASMLGTLDALSVRCGLHIYWCENPQGAVAQPLSLVQKFARGIEKDYRLLQEKK